MTPERKEYMRKYRAENAERYKELNARWKAENKERVVELGKARYVEKYEAIREQQAKYYAANADAISEHRKKQRADNPEHCVELKRAQYKKHKSDILDARAKYRAANSEKIAAYKINNAEKIATYSAEFREANRERLREETRKWHATHPEVRLASNARYRARKANAMPQWDFELTDFVTKEAAALTRLRKRYTNVSWHVDHIVPLRGKLVSGLHVWNNLRVIPASVNKRKSNSFSPMAA